MGSRQAPWEATDTCAMLSPQTLLLHWTHKKNLKYLTAPVNINSPPSGLLLTAG